MLLISPPRFAPALVSLSSHTCFGQEGGVWGSHCLYLNGSVRWAIDDGVQSLLIPRLGETLWCGGTWKERAAARDPKWSLTIIKYYHPEAGRGGGWRGRGVRQRYWDTGRAAAGPERRGVCWGPSGWSTANPPPNLLTHPLTHILDFGNPQSVDCAVFQGKTCVYIFPCNF